MITFLLGAFYPRDLVGEPLRGQVTHANDVVGTGDDDDPMIGAGSGTPSDRLSTPPIDDPPNVQTENLIDRAQRLLDTLFERCKVYWHSAHGET
jgi:hypothetical protein